LSRASISSWATLGRVLAVSLFDAAFCFGTGLGSGAGWSWNFTLEAVARFLGAAFGAAFGFALGASCGNQSVPHITAHFKHFCKPLALNSPPP
jgi:hypothetical protein